MRLAPASNSSSRYKTDRGKAGASPVLGAVRNFPRPAKLDSVLSTRPASVAAPASETATESASLFSVLAFGALLGLLVLAPYELSGFWTTTYDFWPQALWLLCGAGGALLLALSPDARPKLDATGALLLAVLGWNTLSLVTATYRHDAYLEAARVFGALLPFFAIRALWNEKRAPWIVAAWVLGLTWVCLPALADWVQTRYPRQAGPFFNTNLFANALAMTLPVALVLPVLAARLTAQKIWRIAAGAPFLVCALGLVVTSSKGGFLAALVGILVTTLLVWRAKSAQVRAFARQNRVILLGAAIGLVLIFGAIALKTIVPRLQNARGSDDNSTMFRAYIWRSTLDMARAKPLLGFGPGAFPQVYPRFALVSYTRSAHESWLQIAAENGVPALLLLLGAIGAAIRVGWRRLKTRHWPLVAGATGAIAALLVHGCVDSGFQTTSIVILLATALALLTADNTKFSPAASRLNLGWIGATLLLALGGNLTQRAASGEDLRAQAEQFAQNGSPTLAIPKMLAATEADPTSARGWGFLGRLQESSGGDGRAALQTAAALQPTRASNWANLARVAVRGQNPAEAERLYARALAQDPLDTQLRLERAQFRLSAKNSAGTADLEAILALKTAPYGRYEPVEQNVNLDFARATLLLAPELKRRGQNARLQSLVKSALADCARARRFVAQNALVRRELGGDFGLADNDDLESLAAALQALQTK